MKAWLRLWYCIGLWMPLCASAALDLELTQGMSDAIPIAVLPFHAPAQGLPLSVGEVVHHDLQNSGWFNVMPDQDLPVKIADGSTAPVDWSQWRALKLNALVTGRVMPADAPPEAVFAQKTAAPQGAAADAYRVSFHLYDVVEASSVKPTALATLLTQTFVTPTQGMRALAHHISDAIYEKLTGDKGVFSTRLTYVLVDRRGDAPVYTLAVADADGHNERAIVRSAEPIMSPAWRPDGQALAYVSFEGQRARIYEQTLSTGKRRVLSEASGINGAPAYSPDGKRMALVRSTTGYPKLYVMSLQDLKAQQLTQGWSIDTEPCWAPDGESLYFTSNRGGSPQIYQIDLRTHRVRRITFEGRYNTSPQITPDGKGLVTLHREQDGFMMALMDLPTGHWLALTQLEASQSPTVSPNGKMVLFAARNAHGGVLEMVSVDGRVKVRLPARSVDVQAPAWSPFLST